MGIKTDDYEKLKQILSSGSAPTIETLEALQNLFTAMSGSETEHDRELDNIISIMLHNTHNIGQMRDLAVCFQDAFASYVDKNSDKHIPVTVFASAILLLLSQLCELDLESDKPVHFMQNPDGSSAPVLEKEDILKLCDLFLAVSHIAIVTGIRIDVTARTLKEKYTNGGKSTKETEDGESIN